METNILFLETTISEYIRKDNGCSVHFDYFKEDDNVTSIRATTFNPKKEESFLLIEIPCSNEEEGLKSILDWVKSHTGIKNCSSFTVIWTKRGEYNTFKSYFYAESVRRLLDKFFFDKNEDEYVIHQVIMNPIS
jgi:hypothetical protein